MAYVRESYPLRDLLHSIANDGFGFHEPNSQGTADAANRLFEGEEYKKYATLVYFAHDDIHDGGTHNLTGLDKVQLDHVGSWLLKRKLYVEYANMAMSLHPLEDKKLSPTPAEFSDALNNLADKERADEFAWMIFAFRDRADLLQSIPSDALQSMLDYGFNVSTGYPVHIHPDEDHSEDADDINRAYFWRIAVGKALQSHPKLFKVYCESAKQHVRSLVDEGDGCGYRLASFVAQHKPDDRLHEVLEPAEAKTVIASMLINDMGGGLGSALSAMDSDPDLRKAALEAITLVKAAIDSPDDQKLRDALLEVVGDEIVVGTWLDMGADYAYLRVVPSEKIGQGWPLVINGGDIRFDNEHIQITCGQFQGSPEEFYDQVVADFQTGSSQKTKNHAALVEALLSELQAATNEVVSGYRKDVVHTPEVAHTRERLVQRSRKDFGIDVS